MADETTKTDGVQFPLNVRLLEESQKIKRERRVIKERIQKIEASKNEVSPTVYSRVRQDYIDQLDKNTDQLLEKKQDIDRELSTLYDAKKKVEANVAEHREKLEEINFRHNLGEYKKDQFHKLSDEQNEKLGKLEKILSAINNNIEKYESLFEGEDELFDTPKTPAEAPPPPPMRDTKPVTETPINIDTNEEYDVGGGEGYFGHVTEDVVIEAKPAAQEGTDKVIATDTESAPKITIVEGEGKGDTFELAGDEMTIGRASSNGIVLKEAKVSRQHACIKRRGSGYLIEDLHSSNGVYVNNEKINEHALSNGDEIKIGDFILKFSC